MLQNSNRTRQDRQSASKAIGGPIMEGLEARCLLSVDLVGAFIVTEPHTLAPGEDFSAAYVVNNNGDDDAPGFSVQMRLSTDSTFGNADDIVLGVVERPSGLAGDSSTSIVRTFSIPEGTPTGSYFLAFRADPDNLLVENDETNNTYFTSSQVITVTEGLTVNLDVFGNSVEIDDGSILTSLDNHTLFGDVDVGQTQDRTFTLMNNGSGTLQILAISISGTNNSEFVVIGNPEASLAPGESMSVVLRFAPTAEGNRVAQVRIDTNDTDDGTGDPSEFVFAVGGAGHEVGGPNEAEIEIRGNAQVINDGDLAAGTADHTGFGALRLNNAERTRTYTIFNTGDQTLTISGITLTGRNAGDYVVLDQIESIDAGQSATFRVRFDPNSLGKKIALVNVFSNDADESSFVFRVSGRGATNGGPGDGAAEIDVQGNGQSIADGDTSPSRADHTVFGAVGVNDATRTRTFTIFNTGTASLDINELSLFGRDADNFVILNQPTSVEAGGSATFQVRFDPDGLGDRRADVRVLSNDADEGEYTFRVRGRGVDNAPVGDGEITIAGLLQIEDGDTSSSVPEGTHFGPAAPGTAIVRTFTITNTGTGVLNLTGPFVRIVGRNPSQFSITQLPDSSLGIGESTFFTVQFNPGSIGQKRATVEVLSDDANEAIFNFDIVGRGQPA